VTWKKQDKTKKENETGRKRLRSLNLDAENMIKYKLRKHIVNTAQGMTQWQ
jgi:hypothetical protein